MADGPESTGLTEEEAARRLRDEGPNELPSRERRTLSHELLDVVREPMTALLLACGGIYVVLGDAREAAMLLGFVVFIVAITLYQERKTERAVEALRELASPRALVIRGGVRRRIAGRDVVRDDVIVLSEGDRVPADGAVRWVTGGAIAFLVLVVAVPGLRALFRFAPMHAPDLGWCAAAVALVVIAFAAVKQLGGRGAAGGRAPLAAS